MWEMVPGRELTLSPYVVDSCVCVVEGAGEGAISRPFCPPQLPRLGINSFAHLQTRLLGLHVLIITSFL